MRIAAFLVCHQCLPVHDPRQGLARGRERAVYDRHLRAWPLVDGWELPGDGQAKGRGQQAVGSLKQEVRWAGALCQWDWPGQSQQRCADTN